MNTSGWIRGYITHNSPNEKLVRFIMDTISKEFRLDSEVKNNGTAYDIKLGDYRVSIEIDNAQALQKADPYALDKYILDGFKKQGLVFLVDKSQYIRYCYGLIEDI